LRKSVSSRFAFGANEEAATTRGVHWIILPRPDEHPDADGSINERLTKDSEKELFTENSWDSIGVSGAVLANLARQHTPTLVRFKEGVRMAGDTCSPAASGL
jgi:hypothetical protein